MNDVRGPEEFTGTQRFMIIRRIGAGGMGVVYEALDRETNTPVALKTLRTIKPDAIWRFKNSEFRALQNINHPNLAELRELFDEGGQLFFTMEMVRGVHFLDYVRRSPDQVPVVLSPESDDRSTVDLPPGQGHAPVPVRAVPLASGADELKLRSALRQLALGLAALHRAHKVHRDIKPSNILVTPEGRVVILDFGLVADLDNRAPEAHLVGTYSYMAPEQASLKPVEAAADWYSVGVLLYQALTGRMPVPGTAREVLVIKQTFEPPPPSTFHDVPPDLDALCVDLLRIDPAARPTDAEILRRLGVEAPRDDPDFWSHERHFVGRRSELSVLLQAFERARVGPGLTVVVHGESGVGKSALTRRFAETIAEGHPSTVVFSGRCYERESVPYKAVDGIIDAMSRHLTTLDEATLAAILPRQKGLLGQVFPVMRKIEAIASAPRPLPGSLDPQVLRARLFFALRDLFTKLAEQHPLVLVIDDLQWADADSLALLAEITRPPGQPRLLLLTTVRAALTTEASRAGRGETNLHSVEQIATLFASEVRMLPLQSLPQDDARALVSALLKDAGSPEDVSISGLADEAGGHPLFIDELVRRKLIIGPETGSVRLEDALWSRIKRLPLGPRSLLELVAVAGAPVTQETAAQAIRVELGELSRDAATLRAQNLVRTGGVRRTDTVETYHDRVREAVLLNLPQESRVGWHRRLALTLEAFPETDPEVLSIHWRGAGDPARAAEHAMHAAEEATNALAFDRAARLYQQAIDLRPPEGAADPSVYTKLADALASAGRGVESARAYQQAAQLSTPEGALLLRRRAAEELLRSGHVTEGLELFRVVLAAVGLEVPKSPQRALASLLFRTAQVRLRGLRFDERDVSQVSPEDLRKIDICWSVAPVLGMVDIIRGSDFQLRALLLALKAGEPYRLACAFAAEACSAATEGGPGHERTAMLLAAAEACVQKVQQPYTQGWLELARGMTGYLEGKWKRCHEHCVRAEGYFNRCTGAWWERATVHLYATLSLFWMGEMGEQSRRVEQGLRQARERGDLFGVTNASTGFPLLSWVARDDPEGAKREAAESMSQWTDQGFFLAHYWAMLGNAQVDLYAGRADEAHARVKREWPALQKSLLLRCQLIHIEALHVRGRAALGAALTSPDRQKLLIEAEKDAKAIEGEKMAYATPLGMLLRAGIAAARGERDASIALLEKAAGLLEAADMGLFAAAARRRMGELMGGGPGGAYIAGADAWMSQREIKNPARMTAMLVPGIGDGPA